MKVVIDSLKVPVVTIKAIPYFCLNLQFKVCLCSLPVIGVDLNSPFNKIYNASQALSNSDSLLFICFFSIFQANDEEARKIAKEGQLMARELLQPHRFYCYYYKVLQVCTTDHNYFLLTPTDATHFIFNPYF